MRRCEGTGKTPQKIHALFGMAMSGLSYAEDIFAGGHRERFVHQGQTRRVRHDLRRRLEYPGAEIGLPPEVGQRAKADS